MVLTPVTDENLTELITIAKLAYCEHYLYLWHDGGEWYLNQYFSPERFKEEFGNPDFLFYVIYHDGAPAGFLKLNMRSSMECHSGRCMEIERIYLVKEAVNKGIGSQVMNAVEKIGKDRKLSTLLLKVMDSSAQAIAFYKKIGYVISGTYRLPFSQMKTHLRGMYLMKKEID